MLKNQKRSTKPCPTCPKGTVFTGEHARFNSRNAAGVQVCEHCASVAILQDLYSRYFSNKD